MGTYNFFDHDGSCDDLGRLLDSEGEPGAASNYATNEQATFIIDASQYGASSIELTITSWAVSDRANGSADDTNYDYVDIYTDVTAEKESFFMRLGSATYNESNMVGKSFCIPTNTGKLLLCWNTLALGADAGFFIDWSAHSGCCSPTAIYPARESYLLYQQDLPVGCTAINSPGCKAARYSEDLKYPAEIGDTYWVESFEDDPGQSYFPAGIAMPPPEFEDGIPRISKDNPTIIRNILTRLNYIYSGADRPESIPISYTATKGPYTLRQRNKAYMLEQNTLPATGSNLDD